MVTNIKNKKITKNAFSLIELSIVILIIGILVAGVTQGSRLIKAFKLSNARTLTQSSPVHSIKGLSFWLDAASETTILNRDDSANIDDEDFISSWDNSALRKSSTDACLQSDEDDQPQYDSDAINGLPAINIRPDAPGLNLTCELGSSISVYNTIFMVIKGKAGSSGSTRFFTIESNTQQRIYFHALGPYVASQQYDGSNYYDIMYLPLNEEEAAIFTQFNRPDSGSAIDDLKLYTNGNIDYEDAGFALGYDVSSMPNVDLINPQLIIGAIPGETNTLNLDIGEIIIFDRVLKAKEREDIEAYLGKKWQIKLEN
jgi:prepilin-type N-terminal cleavage/methylation domain-containing protein